MFTIFPCDLQEKFNIKKVTKIIIDGKEIKVDIGSQFCLLCEELK